MERELLLLGLLRRADMHGYQLHDFINRNMTSCTDLKKPTAYHLLDKMAARGWLSVSLENVPDSNRPTRRVYRLTPAGEAAFQELLRENLRTYTAAIFGGDVGLAFLDALDAAEARALLQERRTALAAAQAALRHVPPHEGSMGLMIDHQAHHVQSELDWLDKVLARLDA